MRKNNEFDFSQPMMQSYAAILIIMLKFYKILFRQFFPLLILLFIQGEWLRSNWIAFTAIPVALVGTIYSIVAFFRHRFYINDDKLIVTKGVFKRSDLEIPIDRIQSVNFHQNIIHQMFNVVKLELDTAGSSGNEMELYALEYGKARALSRVILSRKPKDATHEVEETEKDKRTEIFRLNWFQLLKVGVTENHIRSGGIILIFFIWIYDNLREVGMDVDARIRGMLPMAEELSRNMTIIVFLVLFVLVTSFIISIVRTILRFYGLRMFRAGDGFTIRAGLLEKKENAARDHKIQMVSWSQNLLQKLAGIYELAFRQASSVRVSEKKAIKVAGLGGKEVRRVRELVYRNTAEQIDTMPMQAVHRYYFVRKVFIWSYISAVPLASSILVGSITWIVLILTGWGFLIFSSWMNYKKKKYGLTGELVSVEGGTFGNSKVVMPLYKAQAVSVTNNFFQRKRHISNIRIHSASGTIEIPQVPHRTAMEIKNYILYKTECSRKKWM